MSCSYNSNYNPYYTRTGYINSCNSCNTWNSCNPCNPCNPCPNICGPQVCNIPCPVQPVAYIANAAVTTSVLSVNPPNPIPIGSITFPPLSTNVTVISGFSGTPTTNVGCITNNITSGQFTLPVAGRYELSAYVSFTANSVGTRELYLYKVDGSTGVISLIVSDSRNAATVGTTNITLTTIAEFKANDRLFIAASQSSGASLSTTEARIAIVRLN